MISELKEILSTPIDGASIALFRFCLGMILFIRYSSQQRKQANDYYLENKVFFPHELTIFLKTFPPQIMKTLFYTRIITAFFFSLGLLWPITPLLLLLINSYLFCLDKSKYFNHEYLINLLIFLFTIIDGTNCFALDNFLFTEKNYDTIPYWHLFILKVQFLITYTWAGINKINRDWIFHAMPLKTILEETVFLNTKGYRNFGIYINKSIAKLIEKIFRLPFTAYFFSFGGLIIDLFIIWLLFFEETRLYALPFYLLFNMTNHWMLFIATFPYVNYSATLLFLSPDFSRTIINFAKRVI